MRSIASAAGVTHAAIYRHFTCKEDLLHELAQGEFARLVDEIRSRVPGRAAPRRRLEAVLREFIHVGLDNPNLYEFLFWTLPRTTGSDVAATNDVFALVHEAAEASAASGDLSGDVDQLTGFLLTACIGYVARAFVRPQTAYDRIGGYVAFLLADAGGRR